ncbi:hypothetical protein M9Y10_026746 [Tritrichomonas musculus]|uniref:Uncharacterized protein n=1 Tax=Tritrichomonas musculus TaxID=1915356 RepID=A0ABR2H7T6_9EUKA
MHFLNVLESIFVISGGKVTSLNNLHPEKADFLMIFNEDGKTIFSRLSQFLKDDFPIDVIDEENSKYFKLTQFLKARSPIILIDEGTITSINDSQFQKKMILKIIKLN